MSAAPLDPTTPEGAAAEQRLNTVLAGVLTRLAREGCATRPAAPATEPAAGRVRQRTA